MLKNIYDIFEDKQNGVYQIRCKSDVITVEFDDEEKKKIFLEIIKKLSKRKEINFTQLSSNLVDKFSKEKVVDVLNNLKDFQIIEESNLRDNFAGALRAQLDFFSQGSSENGSAHDIQSRIEKTKLVLLGSGFFIDILYNKASMSGFKQIQKIRISKKIDSAQVEQLIAGCDFLMVDADIWHPLLLEEINRIAIVYKKAWIIIMGIDGTVASIGPLFVAKETGCYNCLIMRMKSCMDFLPYFEAFESYLKRRKKSGKSGGSFMVMYDILASISILEALKYITQVSIPVLYKNFISLDIFSYDINIHPFLKVPECPLCSTEVEFDPSPWLEPITLERNTQT